MKKILANKVYSDITLKKWTKEELIEQIRILEHNWSCSEENFNNSVKNSEKIFAEQKVEIEQLTEALANEMNECCDFRDKFIKLDRRSTKLTIENAELQKQVDKLKEERDTYKNAVSNESEAYDLGYALGYDIAVKDTAKEILNEVAYVYTEDMGYIDWLKDCYFGGEMERLCEKYGLKAIQTKKGVEVE